jgi:hypothetical protein
MAMGVRFSCSGVTGVAGWVLLAVLAATARAHNGEVPVRPNVPPSIPAYAPNPIIEYVPVPRWSWLHWWEANRDPYLVSLSRSTAPVSGRTSGRPTSSGAKRWRR